MNFKHFVLLICLVFPTVTFSKSNFEYAFSPKQGGTELVIRTINEAKQSIRVAAYSFTSAPIAKALREAHKKGIDVKVVLDKGQRTAKYSSYTFLTNQQIPVKINAKYAIMHNKFMIIDDNILQLGSFNYSKAAEYKNAENVLVIRNENKLVQGYLKQWEKLWEKAE